MDKNLITISVVILLLLVGATGCIETSQNQDTGKVFLPNDMCGKNLTRGTLDESLERGIQFLLNNQKPEGNFNYEYNWVTKTMNQDDSQVRQTLSSSQK